MGQRKRTQTNDCRQCGAALDVPQPGQTELRCKYCGVAIAIESPIPASATGTARRWSAAERQNFLVAAVIGLALLSSVVMAICQGVASMITASKSSPASAPPGPPPPSPPPSPPPVDPQVLEAWGRQLVLSHLDRLHRCGAELVKEDWKGPRRFTLALYFNDDGSIGATTLIQPPKPMTLLHSAICIDQEMRQRRLSEERPPAPRSFTIKVPLEFDENGDAREPTGTGEPEAGAAPATNQKSTPVQNAAPKITNEEWGRRRILARLGRLQECGRELLRREQTNERIRQQTAKGFEQGLPEPIPHKYLLTVPFNANGDTGQSKLSPPSPISDCVDGDLRQFVNGPKEWSPQRRSFQIQMTITFDANGNASALP